MAGEERGVTHEQAVAVAQRVRDLNRVLEQLPDMARFAGSAYERAGAVAGLSRLAGLKRELARLPLLVDEIAALMIEQESGGDGG